MAMVQPVSCARKSLKKTAEGKVFMAYLTRYFWQKTCESFPKTSRSAIKTACWGEVTKQLCGCIATVHPQKVYNHMIELEGLHAAFMLRTTE